MLVCYLKSSNRNLQSSEGKKYSRSSINMAFVEGASKKLLCQESKVNRVSSDW